MRSHIHRRSYLTDVSLVAVAFGLALLMSGNADAGRSAPAAVDAAPTNLLGNAELMISYRHQERMWQTPDGALHVVVNRGTSAPNPGLVLNSSYDGGETWVAQVVLASTDRNSTVDGTLEGSLLSLVYTRADGSVVFAQVSYADATRTWQVSRLETAFLDGALEARNPTVALDDLGVAWCGFAAIDRTTNDINLRLVRRPSDGVWLDTGLTIGPTDNLSNERSARLVRIPGGIGLIYRVRQSTFWTARSNDSAPDFMAPAVKINEGTPQRSISDPYASHFSVVGDDAGYLHLVVADDGDALYQRYSIGQGVWTTSKKINGRGKMSYLQIGMANGQVAVAMSAARGDGSVFLSNDYGETFQEAYALVLPPDSTGISYKTGRVETAGRSTGPLAVLQQYEDHRQQRLMVFKVPLR